MNSYLVLYWNGRSMREKFFKSKEDAIYFLSQNTDDRATLWKQQEIE